MYMRNRGTTGAPPVVKGPEAFIEAQSKVIFLPYKNPSVAYAPDNNFSRSLIQYLQKHTYGGFGTQHSMRFKPLDIARDH